MTYEDKLKMIEINQKQKSFYESRFDASGKVDESLANKPTNLWTRTRRRQQAFRKELDTELEVLSGHRSWIENLQPLPQNVLDLGCFTGNPLSLWLAKRSHNYLGIDLSEMAIEIFQKKLLEANLQRARTKAIDFLNNDFPDQSFNLVYAHSVLHHFQDFKVLLQELHRIITPKGIVVSFDPLNTSVLIKFLRRIYRPFQSDKEWEFPFIPQTFQQIQEYFEIEKIQGVMGFAKYGLPFFIMPGFKTIGLKIGLAGKNIDKKKANREGFFLHRCLQVSMLLRKK